ncbi:uncharacterized protein LOC132035392 [Lycium ferocissimum]|uniref:uncharacterized protein LOC132035392 n=1 Tax=Lycium ferocissimum TaxID=112874 RepID=UPI0028158606|nr:uncharacterized protein LOC132035392 [Lycium ferocissimum]
MINKGKSSYYLYSKVDTDLIQSVGDITGFTKGNFPITYLGCPVFPRKNKVYYADLIKKIKGKLHSWKGTNQFQEFSELPCVGRKLLNLDKMQTPNLRFIRGKNRGTNGV